MNSNSILLVVFLICNVGCVSLLGQSIPTLVYPVIYSNKAPSINPERVEKEIKESASAAVRLFPVIYMAGYDSERALKQLDVGIKPKAVGLIKSAHSVVFCSVNGSRVTIHKFPLIRGKKTTYSFDYEPKDGVQRSIVQPSVSIASEIITSTGPWNQKTLSPTRSISSSAFGVVNYSMKLHPKSHSHVEINLGQNGKKAFDLIDVVVGEANGKRNYIINRTVPVYTFANIFAIEPGGKTSGIEKYFSLFVNGKEIPWGKALTAWGNLRIAVKKGEENTVELRSPGIVSENGYTHKRYFQRPRGKAKAINVKVRNVR